MITSTILDKPAAAESDKYLLDNIRAIKTSVGDGLNDDEFTRLLQKTVLPTEAGFIFLSYSDRCLALSVPRQDPADWYLQNGWITAEKEKIARMIAEKYKLSLSEPPDARHACVETPQPHHHLELCNKWETIVVAHPQFLKIRLFTLADAARYGRSAQRPLALGPELLNDLASLYGSEVHLENPSLRGNAIDREINLRSFPVKTSAS